MTPPTQIDPSRLDILGVQSTAQPFEKAINTLLAWAKDPNGRRYVCTCPVYTLMVCTEDPKINEAVNRADMVTADGMPMVWVQRRWGFPEAERVYGPDILLALAEKSVGQGIRHYFWGGSPGVAEKLIATLKTRFPAFEVAGTFSPPMAPLESEPKQETAVRLNTSGAQVIWVGLGSPKQDLWMELYRPVLNAPLLIGVGAAFDFLSGVKTQAPHWVQRSGLEWVFRFFQEPRRLWRRYLVYNPRFVWKVFQQDRRRASRR